MMWADRVALGVAALIALGGFFVWLLADIALKTAFSASFNRYMLEWILEAELTVALPLWLGFRAVGHFGGRLIRRRTEERGETSRPAEPPSEMQ